MSDSEWRKIGIFGVMLADLVGMPLGGYGVGRLLMRYADAPEALALGLGAAGMVLAFFQIYRISKREL